MLEPYAMKVARTVLRERKFERVTNLNKKREKKEINNNEKKNKF